MLIITDSREQQPFRFVGYPCQTKSGTLHTGDYSLEGFSDRITVERKSLGDLAGCMTSGRERFERELERMRDFECACIVVEEPMSAIRNGNYRSKLNPNSFEQSILSLMIRYRLPFLFGHTRIHAEWLAFNALRHFYNHMVPAKEKIAYLPFNK